MDLVPKKLNDVLNELMLILGELPYSYSISVFRFSDTENYQTRLEITEVRDIILTPSGE